MRIAVFQFMHETVTFLPNETGLDDFIFPGSPLAGEALLGSDPRGYIGGFVAVAREYHDVELVGLSSPLWPRTGSGSGWVTNEAYEMFVGGMETALREQGPFDGVYLALHGAMAVRGVPRPEADIARRARETVGTSARIAATFDPHGNEDETFLHHADLAFTVKYFPHYDMRLQGERAARTLVRAIRGGYRPVHETIKVPIISPTVLQWTGAGPWAALVQRALTWEAREPDLYVNCYFGFPWSDVPDVGMTMQATTNGDPVLARRVAQDMADTAWRMREGLLSAATVHTMAEGVALARAAVADGRVPVVLADHSDRSGHATWLLHEIIAQDLADTLVATVASPAVIEALLARGAGEGVPFDMEVGGAADESAGPPVRIAGTVLRIVDAPGMRASGQRWVLIRFGRGNVLVLSPYLAQVIEPSELAGIGIDPRDFAVIAIKSRVHFRRGFDDNGYAKTILLVEPAQPFLGTIRLDGLPYRNVDLSRFYPYGDPVTLPD